MKKLILTCALITSASMFSFAQSTQSSVSMTPQATTTAAPQPAHQQPMNAEEMAERRAQTYKKAYNLNDEQYKGVYKAQLDYMHTMLGYREKGQQPTPAQTQQILNEMDTKLKAAMSSEQYAKYAASKSPQQMQAQHPAPAAK